MKFNGWTVVLAGCLLLPPVLALVFSLYGEHRLFFWDAKTIPCGLQAYAASGDPNAYLRNPDYAGACAGYGYEYMLPPAVTGVLSVMLKLLGLPVFNGLYFLLYCAGIGLLLQGARNHAGSWREPLLFAVLLACGVFVFEVGSGNVTLTILGLMCGLIAASGRFPRSDICLLALCVLASAFKPVFALYLLVPWYAHRNLRLPVLAATALISGFYAMDAFFNPAGFERWLNLIVPVVYGEPHFGVMRVMQAMGLGAGDWIVQGIVYAAWCVVVIGLLEFIVARMAAPQDRMMAALLAATLLLPRLKEYDAVILLPAFFWLQHQLSETHRRWLLRAVIALAFVAPAAWWWLRKLALWRSMQLHGLTSIADPGWLIATQGYFVTATVLLLFCFMALHHVPHRREG